jgi:hypothetical protein
MATILDVFNESARLASNIADTYSREKKYVLNQAISDQEYAAELKVYEELNDPEKLNQLLRYQENPEEFDNFVDMEFDSWQAEAEKAGNNSRYYMDNIREIRKRAKVSLRKKLFDLQMFNEKSAARAAYMREDSRLANIENPLEAREKRIRAVTTLLTETGGGVPDQAKLQEAIEQIDDEEYKKALRYSPDYKGTTKDWRDRVNNWASDPAFAGVKDRDARRDAAIQIGIGAIQERNYEEWAKEHTKFELLLRQAEDPTKSAGERGAALQEAVDIARRKEKEKNDIAQNKNKDEEYNQNQRDSIGRTYIVPARLLRKEGGGGGASATREAPISDFVETITIRLARGLDGSKVGKDSLGNEIDQGININEASQAIKDRTERTGEDPLAIQIRVENGLLDMMANEADKYGNSETAEAIRAIGRFSPDELVSLDKSIAERYPKEDREKEAKNEITRLRREAFNVALNIWAEYQGSDHSPAAENAMALKMKRARDNLIGAALSTTSLLRDIPGTSGTRYRDSGNLTEITRGYEELLANTGAVTKSRGGEGFYIPGSINDSVESIFTAEKGLMQNELGFDGEKISRPDGKTVHGKDKDGKEYRLVALGGKQYLEQKETHEAFYDERGRHEAREEWVPVAVRLQPEKKDTRWGRVDRYTRRVLTEKQTIQAGFTKREIQVPILYRGPNR